MYPNPLFAEVVSAYKSRYKSGVRESFSSYCRRRHVCAKSVSQWMRRRGMDVSSICIEALLEQYSSLEHLPEDAPRDRKSLEELLGHTAASRSRLAEPEPCRLLKGVSITFPDGVIVGIRQTTPEALEAFISSYDPSHPCLCLP